MNKILIRVICLAIGYAIGCIQCAYLICKKVKGVDIRNYGSGNPGTTNVMRVMGKKWGLLVLSLDILKGVLGPLAAAILFGYANRHFMLWAGLGVILGHCYPFWLRFKGGKGVASVIGIYAISTPIMFVTCAVPSLYSLSLTKYVSATALLFSMLLFIQTIVFYHGTEHGLEMILLSFVITVHTFYSHRTNLRRLRQGLEPKMSQHIEISETPENNEASSAETGK